MVPASRSPSRIASATAARSSVSEESSACSNDSRIAVKRTGPDTFLALSTTCTHEGTMISIVNSNTSFECPNHGARYDSNGSVTRQPQSSGSATNLPTYNTSYDSATDILTISSTPIVT